MQFSQHPVIKHFVREILGCTCPDAVFDKIDVVNDQRLPGEQLGYHRIIVGNRLLIHLPDAVELSRLSGILPSAVLAGIRERDSGKYNRFRLVLMRDDNDDFESQAHLLFANIPGKDDRTHLHVISKRDAEVLADVFRQHNHASRS